MFDRMTFARKAHYIFTKTSAVIDGLSKIGFVPDFDCPISEIEYTIFDMLATAFPEVDASFFELVLYESKEMCSEDEFIQMLTEEIETKESNENENKKVKEQTNPAVNKASCNCSCKKENKDKPNVKVVKVRYVPSQDEINKALCELFGFDF